MTVADNTGVGQNGPATGPLAAVLESTAARAELPLTLLGAGYHLRYINGIRTCFGSRAERVVLPMILWLGEQLADPCPEVALAAASVLESLALKTGARPSTYSLREIEIATGFPRETLRRTARQLENFGWIARGSDGAVGITPRFTQYLVTDLELERLPDFRWTAARIRELTDPTAAGISVTIVQALTAMRACRSDELPMSHHWAPLLPPVRPCAAAAGISVCGYNLRHLLGLGPFFDGDLLQVVLLGELGHRNIAALSPGTTTPEASLATALKLAQPEEDLLHDPRRAFNAYSLASCLNIPYETTRRKLAQLCDRDFVRRDAHGLYWVLPHVGDIFLSFNRERRADMLATAAAIEALLETPGRCSLNSSGLSACTRDAGGAAGYAGPPAVRGPLTPAPPGHLPEGGQKDAGATAASIHSL